MLIKYYSSSSNKLILLIISVLFIPKSYVDSSLFTFKSPFTILFEFILSISSSLFCIIDFKLFASFLESFNQTGNSLTATILESGDDVAYR